jgi:hypothetical protein
MTFLFCRTKGAPSSSHNFRVVRQSRRRHAPDRSPKQFAAPSLLNAEPTNKESASQRASPLPNISIDRKTRAAYSALHEQTTHRHFKQIPEKAVRLLCALAGINEVVIAVASGFYGWAVIVRPDDVKGLQFTGY